MSDIFYISYTEDKSEIMYLCVKEFDVSMQLQHTYLFKSNVTSRCSTSMYF